MTCKEEHYTRESHAPILRLQLQLTSIAYGYIRNRNAERRRCIDRINVAVRARNEITIKLNQMRQKVRAWMREVAAVRLQTTKMLRKFRADSTSVTSEDWQATFKGQQYTLAIICGRKELERWPAGVPSLNLIALSIYRWEQIKAHEKRKEAHQMRKRVRDEKKAHETNEDGEKHEARGVKAREKDKAHEKKKARMQKRLEAFTRPMDSGDEDETNAMETRKKFAANGGKQQDAPINSKDSSAIEEEFARTEFQVKQAKKQHE
ncbi:hypothetical protein HBI80_087120 [Parastagonospora nodorum]|nr:hypothetical protein HBI80_087120 [Parastagonospora nodorum]